jgi:hypothetical protein
VRRLAGLLIALAVLVALAGCGSSGSSSGPTEASPSAVAKTPYGKQLAAICVKAQKQLHSNPSFPYPNFDPIHPDASTLPLVASFFSRNSLPDYESAVAALDKVKPPTDQKQKFERFKQAFEADAANLKHQVDAARAKQVATFVATVNAVARVTAKAKAASEALGIPACNDLA